MRGPAAGRRGAVEFGLDSVLSRSGSVLFGVPLLGTAQFALALTVMLSGFHMH